MTRQPLLHVEGLTKRFGGVLANDAVALTVAPGEAHAVIGPNGAGKTTLIGQLSGALRPDRGRIQLRGRSITDWPMHRRARAGLARGFQISSILGSFSVLDNIAMALQAQDGHSFRFWTDAGREPRLTEPALQHLERFGLADQACLPADTLAHGDRRRLELAMVLATDPALVLLDEPVAGMGLEETRSTVDLLAGLKGGRALLLVEHDMDTVFSLADRITVLVGGRVLACGSPEAIRRNEAVQAAYLGTEEPAC